MRLSFVVQYLHNFCRVALSSAMAAFYFASSQSSVTAQNPFENPEEFDSSDGVPTEEVLPESPSPTPVTPLTVRQVRVQLLRTLRGYKFSVDSLTFSPDGTKLVSGGGRHEPFLKVWSVATGKEIRKIRAQQTAIKVIAISPNSQILATSGQDSDVHLWNWQSLSDQLIYFEQELSVMALAITPDSKFLVSGALDGIWLWTLRPRRPFYQLLGYGTPVHALSVAPNGYVVASGHVEGQVRFWNLREGAVEGEFRPHTEAISGLAFTPDGKKLITASLDKTLKVWDLETGKLLHELIGHAQIIRSIALSPDGKIIASSSNDGIRLWSVETGRLLAKPYFLEPDWIQSLAFSPDGRILAGGRFDGGIDLWQVSVVGQPPASELIFE